MTQKEDKFLIIGYGNTLRSDDGVGQIVAEKIETFKLLNVQCIYQHQLTPELVEKIVLFPNIIFIDACVNNKKVTMTDLPRFDINNQNQYGHYCTPEYLLYLTNLIYHKSPQSFLITIPINNLDLGEQLSGFAQQGVKITLDMIKEILKS